MKTNVNWNVKWIPKTIWLASIACCVVCIMYIRTHKLKHTPTIPCTTCKWSSISKICNRESMKRNEQENRSGFVIAVHCTYSLSRPSLSLCVYVAHSVSFWVMSWFQRTQMLIAQHTTQTYIQCSVKIQLTQQKTDKCGYIVNLLVHSMHCLLLTMYNVTRWPLSNGALSVENKFYFSFSLNIV